MRSHTGLRVMCITALFAVSVMVASAQRDTSKPLRIGTSGTLFQDSEEKDPSALPTLRSFIKSETGFDNEIIGQETWQELAEQLSAGKVDLGVFPGHEFAWAQEKHPELQPLAIAVNKYRSRYAHVMVRQDSAAKEWADLKGKTLSLPRVGQSHLPTFVEHQTQGEPSKFFSKVGNPGNFEDALDDVVDGLADAVVVDRVGLEDYQRRKPGRAKQLKELMHSPPFPAPVIAYKKGALDEQTLQTFRDGLIQARRKERGQKLLTFFKLTGFEDVPADFSHLLAESRRQFPPLKTSDK